MTKKICLSGQIWSEPVTVYNEDGNANVRFDMWFWSPHPKEKDNRYTIKVDVWGKTAERVINDLKLPEAYAAATADLDAPKPLFVYIEGDINEHVEETPESKIYTTFIRANRVEAYTKRGPIINRVTLQGNVGTDPETKPIKGKNNDEDTEASIRNVTSLRLCAGRNDYKVWFNCDFWNKQSEICEEYVKKGTALVTLGHFKQESWTDRKTGTLASKYVFVGDYLEMLSSRGNGNGENGAKTHQAPVPQNGPKPTPPVTSNFLDGWNDDD